MKWSPDDVLKAVRASLGGRRLGPTKPTDDREGCPWSFERAELDGDRVLVVLGVDGARYGVAYAFADVPLGPNTGEPCDTPRDWADEIWIDLEEQVLTGGVGRARRTKRSNGLVELHCVRQSVWADARSSADPSADSGMSGPFDHTFGCGGRPPWGGLWALPG